MEEEQNVPQEVTDALDAFPTDVKGEVSTNPDPFGEQEPTEVQPDTEVAPEVPQEETPTTEVEEESETDDQQLYAPTQVEDPGEFKPGDYGFTITTTDGKEHKITSSDDVTAFAKLVDENPELISAGEWVNFTRGVTKMDMNLERDRAKWEADKKAFDDAQSQATTRDNTFMTINNGLKYLEQTGKIPAVDESLDTEEMGAKWGTEYKDEPGVKERLEILKFMADENERRMAAGLEPNFDVPSAYNALQLQKIQDGAREAEQREGEARRTRGAMVTGASTHIPETPTRSNEIVGSGGSLNDLLMEAYN